MGAFDDYTLAGDSRVGPAGAVSWATHRPSGRPVAVTELTDEAVADEDFLDRLRSTAAGLATVADPHVVPVREVVEGAASDGSRRVWVVEDWVDGRELGEVLADGPLTAEQSVALACGILRGLVAVQARGIVHGAVSPATIVVGAGGVPRLIGFGFAGLAGPSGADPRTDTSAVATVLRDLLAGAPAAPRKKSGDRKQSSDEKVSSKNVSSKKVTSKKVDRVVARATSEKTRRRPAGAADLLADLEKAARSDFGRRWETTTSLAALAVAPPTTATAEAAPAEASTPVESAPEAVSPVEETQELPADLAGPVTPGESTGPAAASFEPAPDQPSPGPADEPPGNGPQDETAVLDAPLVSGDEREPIAEAVEPAPLVDQEPVAEAVEPAPLVDQEPVAEAVEPAPLVDPEPVAGTDSAPTTPDAPSEASTPATPPAAPVAPKPAASGSRKRDRRRHDHRRPSPPATPKPTPAPAPPSSAAASTTWGDRAPEPPRPAAPAPDRWARRDRRQQRRGVVRNLAGVILLLLGAGAATAVERIQSDDAPAADGGGADQVSTTTGPTDAEVAASDIAGTWLMNLTVVESTGFFGTRTGNRVDKIYTITSDCSRTPCTFTLAVSGQTGLFTLHREGAGYVLDESGPNDCVDLGTGAMQVPNGGVAKVQAELRPSGAARTPRGDWAATGLTGSIVTTFDTTNPACVRGSGRQRSTVEGIRQ